jgi:ParB-like chromosome segregation protein Spo0J
MEPVRVRTASLLRGDSPRSAGEVEEHARLLAESAGPLPPILVHRPTMRVIDGMHRLRAAELRGDEDIEVRFFDGDESEAFVVAVQANISHGLPLSRTDRESAVQRLVSMFPDRSDRWIAGVCGLSSSTVAGIRRRVVDEDAETATRMGRDGRIRPLNSARARRLASTVIAERPEASLREVARLAGLSPATVRDVRDRMRRGDDPVPPREREVRRSLGPVVAHAPAHATREPEGDGPAEPPAPSILRRPGRPDQPRDLPTLLRILSDDPSLRLSESGRNLLRWLVAQARASQELRHVAAVVPPHCAYLVAELARGFAREWAAFAGSLEQRVRETA